MEQSNIEKKFNLPIIIVSILIPVVVAILFSIKLKDFGIDVEPLSFLPPIYAAINAITAVLLVTAVIAIKNGNKKRHELLMKSAIACSLLFLVMYVAYHLTSDPTPFGGTGWIKAVYLLILLSHIALSIIIIPLVLFTYVRALSQQFDKHKNLAKITYPIWLYVAITGVIVYLMISPYYAK
jgi:putative membrane protein